MRARIISMVVLAATLLVASQAVAQSDGGVTFGGMYWGQTHPEAKYQEYYALPRGGYLADYVLREFKGPWAAAVWGKDALTRNQGNNLYVANGVRWRLDAKYNETPHNVNFTAKSPWTEVSPGVFLLPDVLQQQGQLASAANYNKGMANVMDAAATSALGIQTNVTNVRLRARPFKDWQFEMKGSQRERHGSLAYGAAFGMSNDIELGVPINQRIVDLDGTANYVHGPARVMASFGVTKFHNRVPTLVWDNPKVFRDSVYWASGRRSGLGSTGRMAMWPDNNTLRGNAVMSVQLPYASTFTASLGVSQTTQDAAFIPLTIHSKDLADSASGLKANSLWALPAKSLDGKIMTITQDYRLTGRPIDNVFATLRAREERFDDQTPDLAFVYGLAATDQNISRPTATSPGPVTEEWSHRNNIYGVDVDYSLGHHADVALLLERRTRVHNLRESVHDVENVFGGTVRARPLDEVSVSASGKYAQRTMDEFVVDAADRAALRRFDLADRNQMAFNGSAMWSPNEKLDLSATAWWNKDDFNNTAVGLKSVQNLQFFGEGAVHPVKDIDLRGGFGYGQLKSEQAGIEGGSLTNLTTPADPWTSSLDDKNVTAYANASWWAQPKKLLLSTQYTFTRDFQTNALRDTLTAKVPGTLFDLPNTFNRTHDVMLEAHWYYAAALEFGCRYGYTKYDIIDPLAQTVPYLNINPQASPVSAASAVFLGAGKQSYTANRFQVTATRRF